MNLNMPPNSAPRCISFIDEAGDYFSSFGLKDQLKAKLREVPGIPNATYLAIDGRVFVFDKLVHLVGEYLKREPNVIFDELALSFITEATVSAKEAVELWNIVPEPYEMTQHPPGGSVIRHRPFDAALPGGFESKTDVQEAFAKLLLGEILPGNGSFAYKAQPLRLFQAFDLGQLPLRPSFPNAFTSEHLPHTALSEVAYVRGFDPISEHLFNAVKNKEASWNFDSTKAAQRAQTLIAKVWRRTATLQLETLNTSIEEMPTPDNAAIAELRILYPELNMLDDGPLYAKFDDYQFEYRYIAKWDVSRDDTFLYYLLGTVTDPQYDADTATKAGQWACHALLRGDSVSDAILFGRLAVSYDSVISVLACRIASAMQFLAEDNEKTEQRGPMITTMSDALRIGRKCN